MIIDTVVHRDGKRADGEGRQTDRQTELIDLESVLS